MHRRVGEPGLWALKGQKGNAEWVWSSRFVGGEERGSERRCETVIATS